MLFIKQGNNAETYKVKGIDGKMYFLKLFKIAQMPRTAFDDNNNWITRFFWFVVLNGDLQNAELGYFTFAELDEFNRYPLLMNIDFNWNKINFRSLQVLLEIVEPEDEFKTDRINNLIADQHFKQYSSDILGEETQKKRGDRGENEYETIVLGTLKDALAQIDAPVIAPYVEDVSSIAIAKAKARAIAIALELGMEL